MGWFLGFGVAGLIVLALSLVFDGFLESVGGAFDGFLDGFLSLPVIALVGWLTWRFSRALLRDGDASAPRGEDLTGTSGAVVTAIPAGGYGEVLLYLAGQPVKYAAKSAVPVERGSEVWVESVLSPTSVTVRPVER